MMKKLFLTFLIGILMMQMAAVAAPADLPKHDAHVLSESELAQFFTAAGYGDIYELLENKAETAYGMNFSTAEEQLNQKYAD